MLSNINIPAYSVFCIAENSTTAKYLIHRLSFPVPYYFSHLTVFSMSPRSTPPETTPEYNWKEVVFLTELISDIFYLYHFPSFNLTLKLCCQREVLNTKVEQGASSFHACTKFFTPKTALVKTAHPNNWHFQKVQISSVTEMINISYFIGIPWYKYSSHNYVFMKHNETQFGSQFGWHIQGPSTHAHLHINTY